MIQNINRVGNFTSSEIAALMTKDRKGDGFGAPALKYIKECRQERKLGRSITSESNARPLIWGKVCEGIAFNQLPLEYELISQDTIVHPEFDFWAGSPDGKKPNTAADIKCPMTLTSFCDLVDSATIDEVRKNHKDGEKFYWQLVSNSILLNVEYAELIIYAPYYSELSEIRSAAEGNPKAYWIWSALDDELPYLLEDGQYKNINIIRFKVSQDDKDALTERVLKASKLL